MAKKNKLVTSAVAIATAAALMLGGTFAWQSINQTALNEASDVINPGGRLHDDFNGSNKDVYVENFADEDIFARVRLEEYFEIVLNHGTAGEKTETIVGTKTKNDDGTFSYEYDVHLFDVEDEADKYWDWTTGGSTIFMPTFNKNKDSLAADLNGNYVDAIGGISNRGDPDRAQYENYEEYEDGEEKTGNAIYDIDANMADELTQAGVDISGLIASGTLAADYEENVSLVSETHEAKSTGYGELISMTEWLDMVEADGSYDEADHGNYWVYDTDGWVYWSAPIGSGEATGLLLDSIELSDVMDDTWYYAINVVAQFITAGDMGSVEDGTGFYDTTNGTVPSDKALELLNKIGVNDTTSGGSSATDPEEIQTLILTEAGDNSVTIVSGGSVKLEAEDGANLSSIYVDGVTPEESSSDWTYDADTQTLTITGTDSYYEIYDATNTYYGTVYIEGSQPDELATLILTEDGTGAVTIAYGDDVKIKDENDNIPSSILVEGSAWTEDSEWSYESDTGILYFYDYGDYALTISDADGTYSGTVYVDDGTEDFDYYISLYASTEDYADFIGNASHIVPGEKYYIYAVTNEDPSQYEEEGYAVDITLRAEDIYGEEVTLTPGEDYTLTPGTQFEEVFNFTTENETEWCCRSELTILNEELLANWLYVEVKAPRSERAESSYIIQEMVTEATVFLYESEGNHNRLTTTLVQPNTYYDIMVEVGGIVIYDSCHPDRVDSNITYTTGSSGILEVYDYEGTATITEDGKLFTGDDPGKAPSWDPDGMGGFMVSLNVYDLRIPGTGEDADLTHAYVRGYTPYLFEHGSAPLYVLFWYENNTITAEQGKSENGVEFFVQDYADTSLAHLVTYTITGNEDENTTVEYKYNDLNFEYDAYLKLGENETAETLTIEVSLDGYITETFEVIVDYSTVTE